MDKKNKVMQIAPIALLCTNLGLDAQSIINFFIRRWTVEAAAAAVTFEEVRRHLGVESQRQWSALAIARTTPALMGVFSIITLWANDLQKQNGIKVQTSAWYQKLCPSFSDAIAAVRWQIWQKQKFSTSDKIGEVNNLKPDLINHLFTIVSRAA